MKQNGAGPSTSATTQHVGPGVFMLLVSRWWLILLGLLITLGLAALYEKYVPPRYVSRSEVLVNKKRPDVVPGALSAPVTFEEYLATQAALIQSPLIAERAVKSGDLGSLKTFAAEANVPRAVTQGLAVRRDPRDKSNSILEVSFRSLSPGESQKVLDAVIRSYQRFLKENYQSVSEETLGLITSAQATLHKDLARKEEEYLEFRRKNPSLVVRSKSGGNSKNEMLLTLHSKLLGLQVRRAELEGLVEQIQKERKNGTHEELIALLYQLPNRAMSEGGARPESSVLEDKLMPALLEERSLMTEFTPGHPQVVAAQKKVEFIHRAVVSILELELASTRTAEQSLARLFEAQTEAAQQGIRAEAKDDLFQADLTRLGQLVDTTTKRLQDVEIVKGLGGYEALVVGEPTEGELALQSNPMVIWGSAAMLGLIGGLGLALVIPASSGLQG